MNKNKVKYELKQKILDYLTYLHEVEKKKNQEEEEIILNRLSK
jgi:hypothetical protein